LSPELFLKLDKTGTMTMEEAIKTLQLKKEIDCLIEQRIQESSSPSYGSEDSSESYTHQAYYQKKFQKVFDTLIDRVENQSSSGNNSADENTMYS
jgi:hypothetical protein